MAGTIENKSAPVEVAAGYAVWIRMCEAMDNSLKNQRQYVVSAGMTLADAPDNQANRKSYADCKARLEAYENAFNLTRNFGREISQLVSK